MFTNTNKQAKNTATNNAVQAFLDAGGTVKRRKSNVPERKGVPANYFTSADAPKLVEQLDSWEVAIAKLTTVLDGSIKVVWNDGRVASSVEEMYGL